MWYLVVGARTAVHVVQILYSYTVYPDPCKQDYTLCTYSHVSSKGPCRTVSVNATTDRRRQLQLGAPGGDELARHVEAVEAATHMLKRGARGALNQHAQRRLVGGAAEVVITR